MFNVLKNEEKSVIDYMKKPVNMVKKASTVAILTAMMSSFAYAGDNTLNNITHTVLSDDQVRIKMSFESDMSDPAHFSTSDPDRIALDFPSTESALDWKNKTLNSSSVKSVMAVESNGRTRVMVSTINDQPYTILNKGKDIILVVGKDAKNVAKGIVKSDTKVAENRTFDAVIENIDFKRGQKNEGLIKIQLPSENSTFSVGEDDGKIIVTIDGAVASDNLVRKIDVTDFGTPIDFFRTTSDKDNNSTNIAIDSHGLFEHFAYQTDDMLTVEFKPVTKEEAEEKSKFAYNGDRISINFQTIETTSLLQLIADFTGMNLVVADAVSGSMSLTLDEVPWDQALDIVLRTEGLGMRQEGNVMYIAPAEEIAKFEMESRKAKIELDELEPLRTDFVEINYATAADIAGQIQSEESKVMSTRGSVLVDERTNSLMIRDTSERLEDINSLIKRLDVPVKQVMIESRIVVATDEFAKALGVQFGGAVAGDLPGTDNAYSATATQAGAVEMIESIKSNVDAGNDFMPMTYPGIAERLITSLPSAGRTGSLAFGFLLGDVLLDLEISAMQAEGTGEIISSPRVVTSDGVSANISQGIQIPYQEASSSGATSVAFQSAAISLQVTPKITPNDSVEMQLNVTKSAPDFSRAIGGVPPIDTRSVQTTVLVKNGQTVVLGGVYEESSSNSVSKVPFFGDLPIVGNLFRDFSTENRKSELLIFVTPRIVDETGSLQAPKN